MVPFADAVIVPIIQGAIQVLLERLVPRFNVTEFSLPSHENNEILFNLQIQLEGVEKALSNAMEKQLTSLTNREWLERLMDAVNQTADLVDEIYSLDLAKSQRSGKSARHTIIQKFDGELKKMTESLQHLAKLKDVCGSEESSSKKKSPRLESTSVVKQSEEYYGRDEDKKAVLSFLVDEPGQRNGKDIPLIAIIGMAGIGKTTLAQLLFNDSNVKLRFSPRAWVHVSEDMDVLKVTKTLYQEVTDQTSDIQNLDTLQRKLGKELKNKQFLFVLDDVWNEDCHTWDELQKAWNSGAPESRIILTTRSQKVASTMRASKIHHLQPLDDEDCWLLFASQAFPRTDAPPLKLKSIAQKKCGGLPLVARELGSLLRSIDAKEWENILNDNIFDLSRNKINILAWFRLSLDHLSSRFLKQCFAYCSIIPKGYAFDKEKLILLWMAQGFLLQLLSGGETEKQITMERVGITCFDELLAKSFFLQASDDDKSLFVMHDLINELAQFISKIQSCLVEKGKSPNISDKTRHVSYLCDGHDKETHLVDVLRKARFLWTFLPSSLFNGSIGSSSIGLEVVKELRKQKRLRVLSLSYQNKKLPKEFGKLLHLRYLDLSDSAIVELPEKISSLYTLQTLILSRCPNLKKLPKKMADLIYLGHLDLTETEALEMMPPAIGKFKSLRILTNFVVSDSPKASSIKELGKLQLLRGKLTILKLQNVRDVEDAEDAKLKEKKDVKELEFNWSDNGHHGHNEVLQKLCPHEDIEKLTIAGYGGTSFPNWLGDSSFAKMVILRLSDCSNCSSLPSLGQLSSLQQLHVTNCGELTAIPNNLTSLKLLLISECRQLKFDNFMGYEKLQHLRIWSCDCLEKLTLNFHRELESLLICDCKDLSFLRVSGCPLQTLDISDCPLQTLDISDCPLQTLDISDCPLQTLDISDCPNLVSFPSGGLPLSLQTLTIKNCVNLTPQIAWGLRNMTSLTHLIIDCAYDHNVTLFPDDGLLPVSLTNLQIRNFKELQTLNLNGLQDLTLLESLQINCNQLEILSDGILPYSLSDLSITGCASLTDNCKRDQGLYWNKISHIPRKRINGNALD